MQKIMIIAAGTLGLTLWAIAAPETTELVFKHANGKDAETRPVLKDDQSKAHGLVTEWYDSGAKRRSVEWQKGKLSGAEVAWFSNGQKEYEGTWHNGKQDGVWTAWYENGTKKSEECWNKGVKHGVSRTWYANGQMACEETWENGLLNGKSAAWYISGQKQYETQWKNGQPEGEWTFWAENSSKIRDEKNEAYDISVRKYYDAQGKITHSIAWQGRKPFGMEIKRWADEYKDGQAVTRQEYEDGRLAGPKIEIKQ